MDVGAALVADGQAAEAIQPGQCAFDHPAMAPEPLARLDAASGDAWRNAPLTTGGARAREVVALVGVQFGWTPPRSSACTTRLPDRHDGVQRGLEHLGVVHIGCREG